MSDDLFPGFKAHWIDTDEGRIFARSAGSGPPLLLLHGFPQTQAMWHRVAPALAERFSVVLMDLRGYGWSSAPRSEGGALYEKRAMGADVVRVMESLGHVRFSLAGHDRGARVGYRLALDHPGRIEKLALLDVLPTFQVWRNIEAGVTPAAHWAFLSRPAPQPEDEIARIGPDAYFEGLLATWSQSQSLRGFDARAVRAYRDAWGDTTRIHAFCEDYRAGAKQDRAADEADLAARRAIDCPVSVVSGSFFLTAGARPAVETWRESFAPQAVGAQIDAGHFVAEENAPATLAALQAFF
ncbi:MAG: alpha/beta hydrolase [Hyphomicrobiales bacterium]|nr:alpha/beta hydrolase [Hyphomicrobiales bacterium]